MILGIVKAMGGRRPAHCPAPPIAAEYRMRPRPTGTRKPETTGKARLGGESRTCRAIGAVALGLRAGGADGGPRSSQVAARISAAAAA